MHLLLDAASMEGYIFQAQDINEDHRCLFEGKSKDTLGSAAPWMFSLDRGSYFANWVAEHAPGKHWGIMVESKADEEEVYRHLRKFLIVQKEDGKELYFRFYDPRVLRVFLPTCDAEQLEEMFGEIVASFVLENEDGNLVRFGLIDGKLEQQALEVTLDDFLNTIDPLPDFSINSSSEEDKNKPKKRWNF